MAKILIATNHSYMLYQFRRELIEALLADNEVVLSMPFVGHEDDFAAMGCHCVETPIDRRGINPITDLKLLKNYFQLISSENPDKVITYSIKPNIYAGLVCRIKHKEYFANVQGLGTAFQKEMLAKIVTVMYKTALKKAKTVFFENSANADIFIKRKIISPNKIKVLNGAGVNLDTYPFMPYPEDETVRFLFVGRIMKEKGVDELFAAFKRLKSEYREKVELNLIGFFEDEYKETVEELDRQGIVHFHGFQTDTKPFYRDCSCAVLPSYHEGLSNVLLEASAMGRPVITTDIPGCKEAVNDEETGFLVNVKDADSLYDAMKRFVGLALEEKKNLGKNARKKMEKEFDKKEIIQQTIEKLLGA